MSISYISQVLKMWCVLKCLKVSSMLCLLLTIIMCNEWWYSSWQHVQTNDQTTGNHKSYNIWLYLIWHWITLVLLSRTKLLFNRPTLYDVPKPPFNYNLPLSITQARMLKVFHNTSENWRIAGSYHTLYTIHGLSKMTIDFK